MAMMFWACLMAKEFFIGSTLEKYLVPYAISHMLVMLPATYWFMALSSPNSIELSAVTLMLMAFNFCSGAIGEIARKTKSPSEERETVQSYTQSLGIKGGYCSWFFGALNLWIFQPLFTSFIYTRGSA